MADEGSRVTTVKLLKEALRSARDHDRVAVLYIDPNNSYGLYDVDHLLMLTTKRGMIFAVTLDEQIAHGHRSELGHPVVEEFRLDNQVIYRKDRTRWHERLWWWVCGRR